MKSRLLMGAAGAWLLIGCAGLAAMLGYEKAPGTAGETPLGWPVDSAIPPAEKTLILFAHPHCPCTRASIAALERIMAHEQGKVAAHVLFLSPPGGSTAWVESDLWRSAQAIPGVDVRADVGGAEERRFHAGTSGQTVVYAGRRLVFAGGITSGRGHFGDSIGADAVRGLLEGTLTRAGRPLVYGCPLESPKP